MKQYTPENITELKPNEIFVFGSNLNGNHAGGAARVAVEKFGAIWGQSEGLQGQSYALPTLDKNLCKLPIAMLAHKINTFAATAKGHPELTFYLTKIGLGIAGYSLKEMREALKGITFPDNVIIPREFDFKI